MPPAQSPMGASLLAMNDNAVNLMKTKTPETQLSQEEKAAYDARFRAQVQACLDDPRPSISNEGTKQLMAAKREKIKKAISP